MPKTVYRESAEVESILQKRVSERSQVIDVPRVSCRGSVEVVKSVPQERLPGRMGKLSRGIEAPEIPCQESVEVDPVLLRTVKQYLDTEREAPSRFFERLRERIEQVAKERSPSIFAQNSMLVF